MSLSLRGRTAVGCSALFLTIQGLTLWGVYQLSKPTVIEQSGPQLAYAEQAFMHMLMEYGERIVSESRILAADYGFRTTVSEADPETIGSALDNLTARIAGRLGRHRDIGGPASDRSRRTLFAAGAGHQPGRLLAAPSADSGQFAPSRDVERGRARSSRRRRGRNAPDACRSRDAGPAAAKL